MKENSNDLYKFTKQNYSVFLYNNSCKIPDKNKTDDYDFSFAFEPTHKMEWEFNSKSNSEEEYKNHYGNPLASVNHRRFTLVVGKNESKTYIKLFEYMRYRDRGQKFFRVKTMVHYLSYNFITNSLYTGYISNYHKKRKFTKVVKKNKFIDDPLNRIKSLIHNNINNLGANDSDLLLQKSEIVNRTIQTFIDNLPGCEVYKNLEPEIQLYKRHLSSWGVKLSNNWEAFISTYPQPKKSDFKKNKMKFIDTIMSIHSLNGDKVKKTLHEVYLFPSPEVFRWSCNFFGRDFILSQPTSFLKLLFEATHYVDSGNKEFFNLLTKKEKENCFTIYKLCLAGEIDITTFYDHLRMYKRILQFEEIKWLSNTYSEFSEEHYQWSERLGFYTKGEFKRIYGEKFLQEIQQPIILEDKYYPVVLTTSKEYNMESFTQSNCVKGYISRAQSLIISLRKSEEDSTNRITIEFKINTVNDKIILRRVQTLGRFNKKVSEDWNNAITILDVNIDKIVNEKKFELPSVELKLGHRLIKSESEFIDSPYAYTDKYLDWKNSGINNIESLNNNVILEVGNDLLVDNLIGELPYVDIDDFPI